MEICNVVVECSPDISVIEPSDSSPGLCDDSTEFNRCLLEQVVVPKDSQCSVECTNRGISIKKRHVEIQEPMEADRSQGSMGLFCMKMAKSETSCGANKTEAQGSYEKDLQESTRAGTSYSACSDAGYYRNKLLSTTQVLENSSETVRVQCASLREAEARIARLAAQLQRTTTELQTLKSIKTEKIEVCSSAHTQVTQDIDNRNVVCALQNNLSVIEDLYKECFYEAAKQDSLIEMLRQSCMEVRAMEGEERRRADALYGELHAQRCSLDRCQDISLEVDSLKMEISNFLNSSNNDSGMWEEGSAGEAALGAELHDILQQLLRLRDMLVSDCTCGLQEENKELKLTNKDMEIQIIDLQKTICDLETTLHNKSLSDQKHEEQMADCTCDLIDENKKLKQTNKKMEKQIDDQNKELSNFKLILSNRNSLMQEYKEDLESKEKELQALRNSVKTVKIDGCSSTHSNISQTECTCELLEENERLKETNKNMKKQIDDLSKNIRDLEILLNNKSSINQEYKEEIEAIKKDLQAVRKTVKTQKESKEIDVRPSIHSVSQTDCPCELEEENKILKQSNKKMKTENGDLQQKIGNLEMILCNERSINAEYKEEIAAKEKQLSNVRERLSALEEENRSRACDSCNQLTMQLQQTQVEMKEKVSELSRHSARLQAELAQALDQAKESDEIRTEVEYLRSRLAAATQHIQQIDACCSEKASLQAQLEHAHERGAALCAASRRAVRAVRRWGQRARDKLHEQEQKLKEKDDLLIELRRRLEAQHDTDHSSDVVTPSCSKCYATRTTSTVSMLHGGRQHEQFGNSASEMASCSSAPPPVPPKRALKKLSQERCQCRVRSASAHDTRRDGPGTEPAPQHSTTRCRHDYQVQQLSVHQIPIPESPSDEMYARVEHLSTALAHSCRRWMRHSTQRNDR